jgi:hypothetical protein
MANDIAGVAKWTYLGIVAVIGITCLLVVATTGTATGREPLSGSGLLVMFFGLLILCKLLPFLLGMKFLAWVRREN